MTSYYKLRSHCGLSKEALGPTSRQSIALLPPSRNRSSGSRALFSATRGHRATRLSRRRPGRHPSWTAHRLAGIWPLHLRRRRTAGQPETVFDLASVTKVVATTTVAMVLHERGLLPLDAPVADSLPNLFRWPGTSAERRRERVTFACCWRTPADLPAYEKLFQFAPPARNLFAPLSPLALTADPGTRADYSDIGFILLGEVLARRAGSPLDLFAAAGDFYAAWHDAYLLQSRRRSGIATFHLPKTTAFFASESSRARSTTRTPSLWAAWQDTPVSSPPAADSPVLPNACCARERPLFKKATVNYLPGATNLRPEPPAPWVGTRHRLPSPPRARASPALLLGIWDLPAPRCGSIPRASFRSPS